MEGKLTIGGHSRWFRLAVLCSVLFVLFVSILAVGAVDRPGSGGLSSGQGGDGEFPNGAGEPPSDSTQDETTNADNSAQNNTADSANNDTEQDDESTDPEQDEGSSGGTGGGTSSYGGTSSGGYPEQSTVGGSIELSNQPELRIESPEPSRWRLGGYDRYTGAGWERDSNPEPLREPLMATGSSRPQYAIQVETLRPFRSLATVWRPFAAEADRPVFVTDQRGFVVDEPLDANERYTTITYGPPSRSEATTATGDAPTAIQQRYTQLPSDTPDRLTAKTAEITAGADTPYEAAAAVEGWLEANKRYSLDAGHDRSNDVATEFVFEMDAGYCQYFATAMTAMLRTQDIPTRYVTGYTTGEQVDENTYVVRGKNAHAWVEVYFDGVGWVSFDPTPGGGRADAGRSEPSSPAEQDQNDSTQEEQSNSQEDDDQTDDEVPAPPYEISLSPDPVPGATVTVTVEKDGEPVTGVQVSFNGEAVGTTDDAGIVQATVPYATELTVSAAPPSDSSLSSNRLRPAAGGGGVSTESLLSAPVAAGQTAENSSVSYTIPTEVTVQTSDIVIPGRSVDANMSLNGSAVSGLDVFVSGAAVATTDEDGAFSLPVPADATLDENLTIRFDRDQFAGEGSVGVADVDIDIETGIFKLPGRSAAITVTAVDGDQEVPLEAVPIQTNGGRLTATTDGNGTASMTLPWSNEGTATAVVGKNTVTASVSGILLQLLAILAVPVVGLVGAGVWVRRNPERVRWIKRRAVGALVAAGTVLQQIGHWAYTVPAVLYRRLLELAGRVQEYFARLRDGITLEVLLSPVRHLIERVTGFLAWMLSLPGVVRERLFGDSADHSQAGSSGSKSTESGARGNGTEEGRAYRRLQQCWRWLVRRVVRRSQTKTAVEVEKRAVEKGLPLRPVRRLRRAFQDVEYGFAAPDDRVDVAEDSVEQLQADTEDPEQ